MERSEIRKWWRDAKDAGWRGIREIVENSLTVHGEVGRGLWRCDHCGEPVADPCICDDGCVLLTDADGTGSVPMCQACYEAAVAARAKIIIDDDGDGNIIEDEYALTAEEKTLAAYLDRAQDGRSRQARSLISMYPRNERRQLHSYQDQIDDAANRRGKGTTLSE